LSKELAEQQIETLNLGIAWNKMVNNPKKLIKGALQIWCNGQKVGAKVKNAIWCSCFGAQTQLTNFSCRVS
jgi:hypothetical protein